MFANETKPAPQSSVGPIQTKLTIGQPGDKYEQEADQVAARVVQQINSPQAAQKEGDVQRSLSMHNSVMRLTIQRQSTIPVGPASNEFEKRLNQARGGGSSLEPKIRNQMESAMEADFSGVTIHTSAQADQLNQSIQAKAFTTGQDVFFRQGEYQPRSREGQELIAHELTHVVQQKGKEVLACRASVVREPISSTEATRVQAALNGGAEAPLKQKYAYGLISGTYDWTNNTADAHVAPGGKTPLTVVDMLMAVSDLHQAMAARKTMGGPEGEVEMHPQGAAVIKIVVEMLGSTLGGAIGNISAKYYKWKRKGVKLSKGKLDDEMAQEIIPEHMAFLGALREVGGVDIKAIIPATTNDEFDQSILDNTREGKARLAKYETHLKADKAASLLIKVSAAKLPAVITGLQKYGQ
ncbi:eCIS core domain-containing protein [Vasconcelosia minhoensis]|uniref:eCIS core domain-containing protein n=1 Tax=Vasconcelosia minhoensis TaxID=3366354 RepID=UPI002AD526C6|nr:DUF4157 domain-containing protein [Romeria gracilis]